MNREHLQVRKSKAIVGIAMLTLATLISNGAELGGATGAMAPLVFWSRKVLKSKFCSLEWHQLFLPSFGADAKV